MPVLVIYGLPPFGFLQTKQLISLVVYYFAKSNRRQLPPFAYKTRQLPPLACYAHVPSFSAYIKIGNLIHSFIKPAHLAFRTL